MAAVMLVVRKVVSVCVGALLKALMSEKVIIELMIKFGDWLVKRTGNDLDDKAWTSLREQLLKNLNPGK